MIKLRLKKLKDQFVKYNLDGYVVPKNDEFFSEYSNKDRLGFISNFKGSAGYAVILKENDANRQYPHSVHKYPNGFSILICLHCRH